MHRRMIYYWSIEHTELYYYLQYNILLIAQVKFIQFADQMYIFFLNFICWIYWRLIKLHIILYQAFNPLPPLMLCNSTFTFCSLLGDVPHQTEVKGEPFLWLGYTTNANAQLWFNTSISNFWYNIIHWK